MREHLGVGLPGKNVAFADELIAQRGVVLDHAVVADREASALIEMRVRVLIRHTAVRGPSRVRDAGIPGERRILQQRGEIRDAPGALARFDLSARERRDSGAVIAPVFETTETVQEDWDCWIIADVADDAAHEIMRFESGFASEARSNAHDCGRGKPL